MNPTSYHVSETTTQHNHDHTHRWNIPWHKHVKMGVGFATGLLAVRTIWALFAVLTLAAREGSVELEAFWTFFYGLRLL